MVESLPQYEHETFLKDHQPKDELCNLGVGLTKILYLESGQQEQKREHWKKEPVFFVAD
jgi:hypothetical protein